MEPNIWGPGAWTFLHSITLNYPDNPTLQQKKHYSDFFNMLQNVLPCSICKDNLKIHMQKYPINFNLDSKDKFVKWLMNIHNETNILSGKKKITYKEFLKIYEDLYRNKNESITYYKSKNSIQKKIIGFLILILIGLLIIIIFQKFDIKTIVKKFN